MGDSQSTRPPSWILPPLRQGEGLLQERILFQQIPLREFANRDDVGRAFDRLSHEKTVGEALCYRCVVWVMVECEIVDRYDEWSRAPEGDVEVQGMEEVNPGLFDECGEEELLLQRVMWRAAGF